jgi:hypothetical protein
MGFESSVPVEPETPPVQVDPAVVKEIKNES